MSIVLTIAAVGSSSRLPSIILYSSRPSNTAARASTASGRRQLRGLVARGWKRMIILWPWRQRFGNGTNCGFRVVSAASLLHPLKVDEHVIANHSEPGQAGN